MNPAPRTTEEEWEEWPHKWIVRADLARELETQLTEMKARAEKAEAECVKLNRLLIMSRDDRENDLMSEIDEQARLLGLSANQNAILLTKVNNLSLLWSQFIYTMDIIEESDSGNEFRPNRILSCRALDAQKMSDIIEKAKLVVNAGVKSEH
jgi:hypothetical protein